MFELNDQSAERVHTVQSSCCARVKEIIRPGNGNDEAHRGGMKGQSRGNIDGSQVPAEFVGGRARPARVGGAHHFSD